VPEEIVLRQLALFDRVDEAYGEGVRATLAENGVPVPTSR